MAITLVDDVRLKMTEAVSSAVLSEFFKGARCLYICCDRAFAHVIDHFGGLSARWELRPVVRYGMSTTSANKDEDDSTVIRNNWIIPSIIDDSTRAFQMVSARIVFLHMLSMISFLIYHRQK